MEHGTSPGERFPFSRRWRGASRTTAIHGFLLRQRVLERSCTACHSGDKPRVHFRLDSRDALLKGGYSGAAAILPGRGSTSIRAQAV